MQQAIWAIIYDIAAADLDQYNDWFHHQHIAEKLARPGYEWAAHYAGQNAELTRHIALFGGASTKVFLDPSPAQLKPGQDDLTRQMIGLRQSPRAAILTREWAELPQNGTRDDAGAITASWLEILAIDAAGHDEALGAWCVQNLGKHLGDSFDRLHKLISITSTPRHYIMLERPEDKAQNHALDKIAADFATTLTPDNPVLNAYSARRIWPPQ